ncbi:MAG TPA: response regulator [Methanospirillum sp.]|uniref:response regulator n=1 Tax=Methanospirillum sp. TaxID=45200 RepID=UPI002C4C2008|nr:response regulator [Methanospirillum sp.]HWQ65226.1 response regulator [Methanospirillum sp.]
MISILLVDDEPVLLDLGSFYLTQREHFTVDTASNGKEALERLEKRPYQIVVSDYDMPYMNGIELLREVKQRSPNQPFIIFTGKGREEVVIEALNLGADFYLQKGGDAKAQYTELAHKCRRATERRQAQDQIRHLARLYSLLSRVNKAVYQIRSRDDLTKEVCHIAIEQGGFKAASVCMLHPVTNLPEIVAYDTSPDTLGKTTEPFLSPDSVPTLHTLKEDRFHVCSDNRRYPHEESYGRALCTAGFLTSASFPLKVSDGLIGALTLHSDEADFFSEEEVLLMMEITESLSLAFELMAQEREKEQVADRLNMMLSAIESDNDAFFLIDIKGTIQYANHAARRITSDECTDFKSHHYNISSTGLLTVEDIHRLAAKRKEIPITDDGLNANNPSARSQEQPGLSVRSFEHDGSQFFLVHLRQDRS